MFIGILCLIVVGFSAAMNFGVKRAFREPDRPDDSRPALAGRLAEVQGRVAGAERQLVSVDERFKSVYKLFDSVYRSIDNVRSQFEPVYRRVGATDERLLDKNQRLMAVERSVAVLALDLAALKEPERCER